MTDDFIACTTICCPEGHLVLMPDGPSACNVVGLCQEAVRALTTVCASDLALFTVSRSLAQPLAAASFGSRFPAPGPCSTLKVFFGAPLASGRSGTSPALLSLLSLGEPEYKRQSVSHDFNPTPACFLGSCVCPCWDTDGTSVLIRQTGFHASPHGFACHNQAVSALCVFVAGYSPGLFSRLRRAR